MALFRSRVIYGWDEMTSTEEITSPRYAGSVAVGSAGMVRLCLRQGSAASGSAGLLSRVSHSVFPFIRLSLSVSLYLFVSLALYLFITACLCLTFFLSVSLFL